VRDAAQTVALRFEKNADAAGLGRSLLALLVSPSAGVERALDGQAPGELK
jgi:hypothetical protein